MISRIYRREQTNTKREWEGGAMDWLIGVAAVVTVCALVGLLLFVLMHLMAQSR